jgi:hypothetical protein
MFYKKLVKKTFFQVLMANIEKILTGKGDN